jgi:regulator of replication initiation timing
MQREGDGSFFKRGRADVRRCRTPIGISRFTRGLDGTRDIDGGGTAGPMVPCGRWEGAGCVLAKTLHVQGILERGKADHAKADQVRMARDVATMFDELRALADRQAELHADRTQLQAELESARARIIDLQAESAQVRKEVADERVHSGTVVNQFERVHREHRTDTERERWPWWRRLIGR